MHNIDVEALNQTIAEARENPALARQDVGFDGEWQIEPGHSQFRASIPVPNGAPVTFEADFPPPMGGTGSAPNPLAYCFWGGLACYAMTFAQEAAKRAIELRGLRAHANAEVDQSRALGVTANPPVQRIDWTLEVDCGASSVELEELKRAADEHCPGVWCMENPVSLGTHVKAIA